MARFPCPGWCAVFASVGSALRLVGSVPSACPCVFSVRASSRAASGFVVVVRFFGRGGGSAAGAVAAAAAAALGRSVVVRVVPLVPPSLPCWAVSLPVLALGFAPSALGRWAWCRPAPAPAPARRRLPVGLAARVRWAARRVGPVRLAARALCRFCWSSGASVPGWRSGFLSASSVGWPSFSSVGALGVGSPARRAAWAAVRCAR